MKPFRPYDEHEDNDKIEDYIYSEENKRGEDDERKRS